MENPIEKRRELPEPTQNRLRKYGLDIQVGDLFMQGETHDNGRIYRIGKIRKRKIWLQSRWGNEWHSYGTMSYKKFQERNYIRLDKPIEELELEVLEQIKDVDSLLEDEEEFSEETALAQMTSKDFLLNTERSLKTQKQKFDLMQAVLTRKMNELAHIASSFREQLEKVHKVLGTVELYLGVHEQIVQIQEGQPAPAGTPLHIRQQILYMAEEFGDPRDQGLDCTRIRQFDEWICEPENMKRFLPETKGIIAIQVRRDEKEYGDPWTNFILNQKNKMTYLLIRNGDNVYRIWSNVHIHPRLFPTRDELMPGEDEAIWDTRRREESEFEYKKYGLMIQGLIHRTQIFNPIDPMTNVFDAKTWNGELVFIRDDEALLPTGKLPWKDWQKKINGSIGVGSRIIYRDSYHFSQNSDDFMRNRTDYQYGDWVNRPKDGLFMVVRLRTEAEKKSYYNYGDYKFFYHSGDKVFKGWDTKESYGPRRKRIGFWAYSGEVLNYDQIDLEDIDFYLNCRTERVNYLKMLPLLRTIRKVRLEELEREKHFVKLVSQRNKVPEKRIWKEVEWWKLKNKWKRPIDQDDAKALRMIERRLKNGNG